MAGQLAFETEEAFDRGEGEPSFVVDIDGFEGPLDLLLELARRQKVDLARISVLALAEQYLVFIEQARRVRLELAADYLVMAAWLVYLKSRLLLPEPARAEEQDAAQLADALARRLQRLEQIRLGAEKLINRPTLGRDFFARGNPESIAVTRRSQYEASLYDLLAAYARQRQKHALSRVQLRRRIVWSLAEAREALSRLLGVAVDWIDMDNWLIAYCVDPRMRRTARASCFSASLLCVKGNWSCARTRPSRRSGCAPLAPTRRKRHDFQGVLMGEVAQLFDRPGVAPRFESEALRIAEAVVFAAAEPLDEATIASRLPGAPTSRRSWPSCSASALNPCRPRKAGVEFIANGDVKLKKPDDGVIRAT